MAIGKASDVKVYQEYINGRINELLAQNGNIFNGASNGAISLTSKSHKGDYTYESLFSGISNLAARRDTTATTTVTDTAVTQDEHVSVKLNRKMIPIAFTRDAYRKVGGDAAMFADAVAEQFAKAQQIEMVDTALLAVSRALKQQTASYLTESSLGSISTNTLISMLAKMGDRADRVVCWVMHSKPYYDLVKSQIAANVTSVSNLNIATATPVTCNRPVIVVDSASLKSSFDSPDVDEYLTIGLTSGGVMIENSEEQDIVTQDVTGLENLVLRIQGEYAYNLGIQGFKWDVANGAANPDATAIALGTNWDTHFSDMKNRAGVVCKTL